MNIRIFAAIFLLPPSLFAQSRYFLPDPKDPNAVKRVEKVADGKIRFLGNHVVTQATLLEKSGLHLNRLPTKEEAETAAKTLKNFYVSEGYTLASVYPRIKTDAAEFIIDEGALRGMNVYGLGWWDTYTARTSLLPFDIFDEIQLNEHLRDWLETHPSYQVRYEIERSPNFSEEKYAELLEKNANFLGDLRTRIQIAERACCVLHIYFEKDSESNVFSFNVNYSSSNGLGFIGNLGRRSLFTKDDVFLGSLVAGIDRRGSIDSAESGNTLYFAVGEMKARWYTPPIAGKWLRFFFEDNLRQESEQRADLPLDTYRFFKNTGSANLNFEFMDKKFAYLRLGHHFRHVYDVDPVPSDPYTVPDNTSSGFVLGLGSDLLLSKPRMNYQLNDVAGVRWDFFMRDGLHTHRETEIYARKAFLRKEATYIFNTRGIWLSGQNEFYDERSIESLDTNSSFKREIYLQRGINLGGEVRFNIWNDDIQAGLFNNVELFGYVDHVTNDQSFEVGDVVGPVFYAYFFDAFELSIGFSTAFTTAPVERSYEVNIGFNKVF